MEGVVKMIDWSFWKGKRVFLTGITGFKGAWLAIWLHELGAVVHGFALEPPTTPSIFESAQLSQKMQVTIGNINDEPLLVQALREANPEIIFHLAAQPIVKVGYENPVGTYMDNVIGTVRLMNAMRVIPALRAAVMVTTDKCYENKEWDWAYRETDQLGGFDPYSSSKACAELAVASLRNSFFNSADYGRSHSVAIATARAGNVIGGGDWARDRIIPDIIRAIQSHRAVEIRNPQAVRPWQHVLEPLYGYLLLAQHLYCDGVEYGEAWNFGPLDQDAQPVSWIVETLTRLWGSSSKYSLTHTQHPHEANFLRLDNSKARHRLKWEPTWDIQETLSLIVEWYRGNDEPFEACRKQIQLFMGKH